MRKQLKQLSDKQFLNFLENNYCLDSEGFTAVEIMANFKTREEQLNYLGF